MSDQLFNAILIAKPIVDKGKYSTSCPATGRHSHQNLNQHFKEVLVASTGQSHRSHRRFPN
ncbi:hypothetical protein [Vibrio sp. SCSIO 43136]|uniref:hypothetical protein n=1 Tax=Vibrio sp. SCSIO 43136 TaxID=2819101 RepID=UPI0020761B8B|nr:hypothetical protein [Vibrio sp. SCSIO 43136]USD66484.1 hypothetical protein J4N39_06665 [Vibrio sp. SCSIO 43136]